jgi:hypothetical protein
VEGASPIQVSLSSTKSLFSTTMELTNSFPPADALINKLKQFDYIEFGSKAIQFAATVSAIVVGVVSYVWTAFQLWWEDNGEAVQVNSIRFAINVVNFVSAIVITIPKIYRWVKLNSNRLIDSLFFQFAGI